MEGDAGDGEVRMGPSAHPSSTSTTAATTSTSTSSASQPNAPAQRPVYWWWSKDSGTSVDTIHHVPLARTSAVTLAPPELMSPVASPASAACDVPDGAVGAMGAPLHHSHSLDCCYPLTRPSTHPSAQTSTPLHSSHSLDALPSAFRAYRPKVDVGGVGGTGDVPLSPPAAPCPLCFPSFNATPHTPDPTPLKQADRLRQRRYSLPEPLPPPSPPPADPRLWPQGEEGLGHPPLHHSTSLDYHLHLPPHPSKAQRLQRSHTSPAPTSTHHPHHYHLHTPQPTPLSLLTTLQRYQRQLAEQERLSNQLHRLALDTALHPANHHHLLLHQLGSVRAIRTAIRAEVVHMEHLLARARPHSFSHTCLTNVVAQMMVLLQQQSELCQDLETLTLVTPDSPDPPTTLLDGHTRPPPPPSHPDTRSYTPREVRTPPSSHTLTPSSTSHPAPPTSLTSHPVPPTPLTAHPMSPTSHIIHPTPLSPHPQPGTGENITPITPALPTSPTTPHVLPSTSHTPPRTPSSPPPSSYSSLDVNWSLHRSPTLCVGEERVGERRSRSVPLTSSPFNHPEVAQLVQAEVQNRTSGLRQQLLQQTQDVADIKGMLQALLTRLK